MLRAMGRESSNIATLAGRLLALSCGVLCLGACESVNRAMFDFNTGLDRHVISPVVDVYEFVLPAPIRKRVGSVFATIGTIPTLANNLLQGKIPRAIEDGARIGTNLTVGLAGLFDVATSVGIPQNEEDFGQTLGTWGLGPGPYVVLPLFGPSTARDVWDLPFRFVLGPSAVLSGPASLAVTGIGGLQKRSEAGPMLDRLDESAVDPYVFTREAYLQRRRFLILDGHVPEDDVIDDAALDELMDLPEEAAGGSTPPRAEEAGQERGPARPPQ